jgi:diguanylate cyclase (GGDEF)-like protein
LADCCIGMLRPSNQFGRLGGEEFALLLSQSDADAALAGADRFCNAIADLLIGERRLRVTASFGVAALSAGPFSDLDSWLAAADAALYAAKHAGRNACRLAA